MSGPPRTVLLLTFARRGEEEVVRAARAHLQAAAPDAEIVAVGTPVSAPALRESGVHEVLVYGDGRGARQVVREARGRRPRAAGIVYGGRGFSGHLKLELVALASGARRFYRFRPGEPPEVAGRPRLLCSAAAKGVRAGACLALGGLVCGAALLWLGLGQMVRGGGRAGGA